MRARGGDASSRRNGSAREERSLHLVEPAVDARLGVHVPIGLTAVAQPLDASATAGHS
jgi:hypothetical protein